MRYVACLALLATFGCADDTTAGDGGSTSSGTAAPDATGGPSGSSASTAGPSTDGPTSTTAVTGTTDGTTTGTTGVEFTSTSTGMPPDTTTTGSTGRTTTGTSGSSSSSTTEPLLDVGMMLDVGVMFDIGMRLDAGMKLDVGGILFDVGLPGTTTGFGSTGGGNACLIEYPFDAMGCPDGWSVEATDVSASSPSWECGDPPVDSDEPPDGGSGMWATNLTGAYDSDESSALISPNIDLTACDGTIELWITHWYAFEGGLGDADGGIVQVETSPDVWESVQPTLGYANGPLTATYAPVNGEDGFSGNDGIGFFWTLSAFDLTGYAGQTVRIRFVFGSDDMTTASGWYIDEAVISSTG